MIPLRRYLLFLPAFLMLCWPPLSSALTVTNSSDPVVLTTRRIRDFGAVTPDMIDQLRAELWLQVPVSQKDGVAMSLLSPQEVISARKKNPDIPALAGMKMVQIQRLTLGAAPELIAVVRDYVDFYEGVARGGWDLVLRHRLKRAEAALEKLTRQTLACKIYLDEFEKQLAKESPATDRPDLEHGIPGLEKSRIESYLDGAEKRFDKP